MQSALDILQRQILLTLAYSNVFNQPLTTQEIERRLVAGGTGKINSQQLFKRALQLLENKNFIVKNNEFWQLSTAKDVTELRKRRSRWSAIKLSELKPFISFTQHLDWIKGVAVTGSVSVGNADEKDDADLMIIVQRHRLWLVRPILVLFSFLHGKRRSWNHEEYNSWCLNLWLDEDSLEVVPKSRSVYVAYEVCQAEWLVSKGNIEEQFLFKNQWVTRYLPHYYAYKLAGKTVSQRRVKSSIAGVLETLNRWAYQVQLWYMKSHMTREKVSLSAAFFHPRDTKKIIVTRWKNQITALFEI